MFSQNRGLLSLHSNWGGGARGWLVTDIWGPAHRPNLDRVLLCWGGLWRPSYVTILYVALHLTQLLPDLKRRGGFVQMPSRTHAYLAHTYRPPLGGPPMLSTVKAPQGTWFGYCDL